MVTIDTTLMDSLTVQAKKNLRLRQNYNIHSDFSDPLQRLINAIEPGAYIRPHRHLRDPKSESFVALRGCFGLLTFNGVGQVEECLRLGPYEENVAVDLPAGVWHTVLSLEVGSVLYEAKPGPFLPNYKKDMAPWAPEEGSDAAKEYLNGLYSFF